MHLKNTFLVFAFVLAEVKNVPFFHCTHSHLGEGQLTLLFQGFAQRRLQEFGWLSEILGFLYSLSRFSSPSPVPMGRPGEEKVIIHPAQNDFVAGF